jgi:ferredoxin
MLAAQRSSAAAAHTQQSQCSPSGRSHLPQPALRQQHHQQRRQQRTAHLCAAEGFCRDKVNVDSRGSFQSQGASFTLTFKGVGEESKVVECPDDVYILEAAERAGLDLPATCKSGICGTCVGRIVTGEWDSSDIADIEFTISPEEQAQGLAMLCMTRARSDLTIETQCDWGYSLGVKDWEGATGRFSATPDPLMGKKWAEDEAAGGDAAAATKETSAA